LGNIEELHKRYQGQAAFVFVYVREAHPRGDWADHTFDIKQPTTLAERCEVATLCRTTQKVTMPVVVDEIDDRVSRAYRAVPAQLYVIDDAGRFVYLSRAVRPGEMEQSLIMHLLDRGKTSRQ
jgi:hypothetical protein